MPRSYWLPAVALGLALTAVQAKPVQQAPSANANAKEGHSQPQSSAQPLPLAGIHHNADRTAKPLKSNNAGDRRTKEDERAQEDLDAQKQMATAASNAVIVGGIEAFITFIGVLLVGWTLYHTKRAADAARDAAKEAKRASDTASDGLVQSEEQMQREMRAYVAVEPGGINWLIGRDDAIGHVVLRNVGKLPASEVYLLAHMKIAPRQNFVFTAPEEPNIVQRTVQPGATMTQGTYKYLPVNDVIQSGNYIFVYGIAYYRDGFNKRRYTRFCHRYAAASHDRSARQFLAEKRTPIETVVLIGRDKARYYETGNDSD